MTAHNTTQHNTTQHYANTTQTPFLSLSTKKKKLHQNVGAIPPAGGIAARGDARVLQQPG
jgi:hypothetical protein